MFADLVSKENDGNSFFRVENMNTTSRVYGTGYHNQL